MKKSFFLVIFIGLCRFSSYSQDGRIENGPLFSFKNGLGITSPDSNFSINIRFRFQNRFLMNTKSLTDLSPKSWEARVRRARMSFTGYVFDPRFSYYLQLSFARGDLDWNGLDESIQNTSPNIVRDAMIFYRPSKNLQVALGQGKLPGNRQRVVSSGSLQFFDRSPVNTAFTLDRDFGFFFQYLWRIKPDVLVFYKGAVTSGEGRNSISSNSGLSYTGRIEILPFGEFTLGGDYFEGDIARENSPKLSIGMGSQYNDIAVRSQGQLGRDLYQARSLYALLFDVLCKYQGWALSSEYIHKQSILSPVTINQAGLIRDVLVGSGVNTQLSYCFRSSWEIAGRYSVVVPDKAIQARTNTVEEFGLGVTNYFMKHKTKAQFNIFRRKERNTVSNSENNFLYFVLQLEAGI